MKIKNKHKTLKSYFVNLKSSQGGFTLIEILVVISILALLVTLTLIGLQGSRESGRDAKRKADIETVRTGLEFFKSDCKKYPNTNIFSSTTLRGDGSIDSCATSNTYINQMPKDPEDPDRRFVYYSDGITYEICTSLENGTGNVTCGGSIQCGTIACNYKAINP